MLRKLLLVLSAAALAGCGGGGGGGDTAAVDAKFAAVKSCVEAAGLTAKDSTAKGYLGVEDEVRELEVPLKSTGASSPLVAHVYVFDSAAAAGENRPALTLQAHDDERNKVIGSMVLEYSIIPSYDKAGSAKVESCVRREA